MTRGSPDGLIADSQYAAQITDNAYISNMLWGFSPIDSQGRIIYLDTFNNGLSGFTPHNSGSAILPVIKSDISYVPPFAVVCDPGTIVTNESFISRKQFMGLTKRIGIEFAVEWKNNVPNVSSIIDYNPLGFPSQVGGIMYSHVTQAWQIYDKISGWATFNSAGLPPVNSSIWVQVKLVCDFSTGKYIRAYVGDQLFDLSAFTLGNGTVSTDYDGYLYSDLRANSYGAGCDTGRFGYFLLTKDEP